VWVQGIKPPTFAYPKEPHAQEAGIAVCNPPCKNKINKKRQRWFHTNLLLEKNKIYSMQLHQDQFFNGKL
jgi:hypothetical protein